jgi:hypothetical protein
LADLRPRQLGGAGVGDEPLDQGVTGVAQFAAELDRDAQPRGRQLVVRARQHELRQLVNRGQ